MPDNGYVLELRIWLPERPHDPLPETGEWAAETIGDGLLMEGARYLGGTLLAASPPPRVSIHPHTYRGEAGYQVRADRHRIFTLTRRSAERIRERLRNGEEPRGEDYDL